MFIDKQNQDQSFSITKLPLYGVKEKPEALVLAIFCFLRSFVCKASACIFLSLFLLLVGCHSSSVSKNQRVVKINIRDEPNTLDPRLARDFNSQMLIRMFFEGLTRIGPEDQPQLALAESVKISEDLKTYIFTLREAKWSNGDRIVAGDFVYSWRKILSPDFASDHAFQLYILKNGKAVKEGLCEGSELGVKAVDERTLLIELEYPIPYALELFAAPFFSPVNQKVDEKEPKWAEKQETYVCNGPFTVAKWCHHDLIKACKNVQYWEADCVKLDGIEMVMLTSDVEMKLFEKKELDWCGSPLSIIPIDALHDLKEKKKLYVKPRAETAFLRTNIEKPLLNHPKMRRALALAIDRAAIVEHVTQGGQLPATSLIPPNMQPIKRAYFEDNAKELAMALFEEVLAERKLTRKNIPKLTLTYINSERAHLIAQTIQQQWLEVFGIHIGLEAIERKVYFDRIAHQDFELAFCSWGADFHDPISFLEVFKYKSQSTNNTHWEDSEYASKLNESCHLFNPDERGEVLTRCEEILMEAMPIIPLFHYSMSYMKNKHLQGVFVSSLGGLDFKWASLENGN